MRFLFVLFILVFSSSFAFAENAKGQLTLGFLPYLSSHKLLKKYQPLADYLSEELSREVVVTVSKDYAAHLEATGKDQLDISFLGGSPYVVVSEQYGKKPLLARYEFDNRPHFRSVIYVAENSSIKSIKELEGKRVVFGSRKSTLSTQVPLFMLMREGFSTDDFTYEFLDNHENVIISVLLGAHDAGASAEEVFREHESQGIKAIAYSPYLSTHLFVTRANMNRNLQMKIKNAFLKLADSPNGEYVLKSVSPHLTGFVEARDSDYNLLRGILKKVLPVLEK